MKRFLNAIGYWKKMHQNYGNMQKKSLKILLRRGIYNLKSTINYNKKCYGYIGVIIII